MNVLPTTLSDLPSLLDILNLEIRDGAAHFGLEPIELMALQSEFERFSGPYPWFSAKDNSGVIGFCRAGPWKSRGAYAGTIEVGIYVVRAKQGAGVGRALFEQMIPACFEHGYHTLLAGIRLPNEPCVRLHERFGFRPAGILPEVGFKFGEWHSVGYWALTAGDWATFSSQRPASPTR